MKTIFSSVGFQDEVGTLLGSLILSLPSGVYVVSSGGGQVAGQSLIINLDATGKVPGSITIWASDELSPQVPYAVTLCAQANGAQAVGTANWLIGGTSPIDLSQMVQTSNGISYSGAVLTNPTSQQNINGQTLNIEGAPLGFSATGSTTPDSFFSRISAGVVAVGTAIGNALGTLMATAIKPPAATSFSILDPNGASHFFISGSAPYINTFVNGNGSGVVFLGSAAKAAVSDTTGTVTTAGGVALQTTAQTLPATVNNDTSGGLVLTTNAGKSVSIANSSGNTQLPAGATLLLPGATSGQLALAGPAVAGSNTLTLPAATDTLVGRNTTDTFTNKTVGAGGLAGLTPSFQKFTSSGTFTIPAGITAVKATVVGAGGAGGGATTTANASGTGGFGGGAAIKWLSGLTPGNTLTVAVGTGGTGVANGTGNAGGNSSVSSGTQTISTITGSGGGGGATTGNIVFFSGGSGTGGDLNISGGSPTSMLVNYCNAGSVGGTSIFSGGGAGGFTGAGAAGTNPGAGGGGAGAGAGGAVAGGAGANGLVLFEWMN